MVIVLVVMAGMVMARGSKSHSHRSEDERECCSSHRGRNFRAGRFNRLCSRKDEEPAWASEYQKNVSGPGPVVTSVDSWRWVVWDS